MTLTEKTLSELAGVLAAHRPLPKPSEDHPWKIGCTCGAWWYDFDAHRAHALAPLITELEAKAWDEGFMAAAEQDHPTYPRTRVYANPYQIREGVGTGTGRGGDPASTEATLWVNGSEEAQFPAGPAADDRTRLTQHGPWRLLDINGNQVGTAHFDDSWH
jgi:hypothetical protein